MKGFLPFLFAFSAIQLISGLKIGLIYGPSLVTWTNVDTKTTISQLKEDIAGIVGICAQEQAIIAAHHNQQQDDDGYGELLDHKTLANYGITEKYIGKHLAILRKVDITRLTGPSKDEVTVIYKDQSRIRIPLDPRQTAKQFVQILNNKLDLDLLHTSNWEISDWYSDDTINVDSIIANPKKTLGEYGFKGEGRVIYVETNSRDLQKGTLEVEYGPITSVKGIPYKSTETVATLKKRLSGIIKIAAELIAIIGMGPNELAEQDGGQWNDKRQLREYGVEDGVDTRLWIMEKVSNPVAVY